MSSPYPPRHVLNPPEQTLHPRPSKGAASSSARWSRSSGPTGWLISAGADLFPILLLTVAYFGLGFFVRFAFGFPVRLHLGTGVVLGLAMLAWLLLATVVITIPVLVILYVLRAGYRRLGRRFHIDIEGIVDLLVRPRAISTSLLVILLYSMFLAMFVAFKRAIPEVIPFYWDDAFMRLDRVVHFGNHPWRLLQPILGKPSVTDFIDRVYYAWFPVNYLCITAFTWHEDRSLRVRFYLSFWLVWIIPGTALAYALSSAGPCYFGFLNHESNPFAPLMDYLRQVDREQGLVAVYVQRELWADYTHESAHLVMKGISAMPSVHVALPVLYALAGWKVHRGIGLAFLGYTFLILLGSVHLGWHYAIDGYVSILVVVCLWSISGPLSRWYTSCLKNRNLEVGSPHT